MLGGSAVKPGSESADTVSTLSRGPPWWVAVQPDLVQKVPTLSALCPEDLHMGGSAVRPGPESADSVSTLPRGPSWRVAVQSNLVQKVPTVSALCQRTSIVGGSAVKPHPESADLSALCSEDLHMDLHMGGSAVRPGPESANSVSTLLCKTSNQHQHLQSLTPKVEHPMSIPVQKASYNPTSYVERGMPFDRMKHKLTSNDPDLQPPTDLRLENYWTINFSGIAQEKRTGRAVFEKILTPLVDTWVDPELVDKLRRNLVIFKPEVLQRTYLWTTYPLFWAIDHIYQSEVQRKREGRPANLLLRELLSALERAGSFGFCGAGRVLSTYVMDPLLLSVGIKETGFPCLSDMVGIHLERMEKIDVDASRWPKDAAGVPRFASKRVVLYNYSQATYDRMKATCFIEHIRLGLHTTEHLPTSLPREEKILQSLASYVVETLETDALYEIEKGIKKSLNASYATADRDDRRRLNIQADALKELLSRAHPFDNSKVATECQILTLATSSQAIHSILKNLPRIDVYEWVRGLYAMVTPPDLVQKSSSTRKGLGAPFFRQGSAAEVCTQVFQALRDLCPHTSSSQGQQEFCIEAVVFQMDSRRMYRYPHSTMFPTGRSSQWAQYDSWADLIYPSRNARRPDLGTMSDPDCLAASIASTQITEGNPQASWHWIDARLGDLTWVIKRSRLPLDWIQQDILKDPMSQELTNWVTESYDMSDARFHISLIAAFILTAWAPFHRVKHNEEKIPVERAKGANMVEYANSLVWDREYGKTQSGWKAKPPLFHLWLIYICGILSIKLASRTAEQGKNAEMMTTFNTKLQRKGVTIAVLARLHLVEACKPNAFKPGSRYQMDWRRHPKEVLESRLATISKHLAQPPHMCPVFCAVRYFLGDECRSLHIVESFRVPPMKERVPSTSLAHKASEASLRADSESSEDEAENPGLSARPRKRCQVL
ncbi:uncharacterized protein EI90DRAFT_3137554 [Cantharellus anzutake]|uniref:uncharacterized protein n=1 Tax=Cantharellus anzutake TaxID=1750568 RepID=UPI0019087AFD|nr:uncharacterized protein EI90DRAFT_3137554 [Cantharellus anzutake]KAF8312292.1 hypothetical protein EI90DRAFT_3137554 [Cantharellus anzutake]